MNVRFVICIIILLVGSFSSDVRADKPLRVLCFGDSITAGTNIDGKYTLGRSWIDLLEAESDEQLASINEGIAPGIFCLAAYAILFREHGLAEMIMHVPNVFLVRGKYTGQLAERAAYWLIIFTPTTGTFSISRSGPIRLVSRWHFLKPWIRAEWNSSNRWKFPMPSEEV